MAPRPSFYNLAFRVHLTPAPRTQSESGAVLRFLQDLGPVAAFQIPKGQSASTTATDANGGPNSCVASLVFGRTTRSIRDLKKGTTGPTFEVTANENIPDASIKDPYNVRGLKYRKPELAPRTIQIHIVPAEQEQNSEIDPQSRTALGALADTPYRDTFAVDRNSIFADILARTDCPSGLIHGLLPRLRDEHTALAWDVEPVVIEDEKKENYRPEGQHGQRAGRGTVFARLNTERLSRRERNRDHDRIGGDTVRFHDEFASLRNVSLMDMYRRALRGGKKEEYENRDGALADGVSAKEEQEPRSQ